jgi:hypothetical protein
MVGDVEYRRAEGGEGAGSWGGQPRIWIKKKQFYQLSKTRENWESTVKGVKENSGVRCEKLHAECGLWCRPALLCHFSICLDLEWLTPLHWALICSSGVRIK